MCSSGLRAYCDFNRVGCASAAAQHGVRSHLLSSGKPIPLMRTLIFLLIAIFVLAGCAPKFAKTPPEFRASAHAAHSFVTEQPLTNVYERLVQQMMRCHTADMNQMAMVGSSFVSSSTGDIRVHADRAHDNSGATILVRFNGITDGLSGLLQVVDLEAVSTSSTRVIVHQLNETKRWTTASKAVESWLAGTDACGIRQ